MLKSKTLVSPVSTQVLPIVLTALTLRPERLILLSTKKMEKFVAVVERALELKGIDVERREINPYSFSSIREKTSSLQGSLFLLNCGTKFTAVNLYRLFPENSIYYLPTGQIVDFDGRPVAEVPENLVDVELHSAAYGFKILEERQDWKEIKERAPLTYKIASNPLYQKLLTSLVHRGTVSFLPKELLPLLLELSIVKKVAGGYKVANPDYAGGKWLEELVALELIKRGFYDVKLGVKLSWYGTEITNEVDVLGVKSNRLHLFSCKSGRNPKNLDKHLYEVEELTERIGGDFGRSFLIVSDEVAVESPPLKRDFPSAPDCPYHQCREEWKRYYKTPEGREYSELFGLYKRFSYLKRRAELLKVKVLSVSKFLKEGIDG